MNLLGDFVALGLILILCIFYFESKCFLSPSGKYFVLCLPLTAVTALVDIASVILLGTPGVPVWLNFTANTLFFLLNILTTTLYAMVLFHKILEHVHMAHCMRRAKIAMTVIYAVYALIVLSNIFTGWLFSVDAVEGYRRGPLYAIGYFTVVVQMAFVVVCYVRNRRFVTKNMRRALIQAFPAITLCIGLQLAFPDVMLNSLIMSLVALTLFLNFDNQRIGVHTLTDLNDRHRFFLYIAEKIKERSPCHVYVVQLTDFETVNRKHGHIVGDEILYLFAFSLEKIIPGGVVFHMDGLSFSVVVPAGDEAEHAHHLSALYYFLDGGIEYGGERIYLGYTVLENTLQSDCRDAGVFYEELEHGGELIAQRRLGHLIYSPEMGMQRLRRLYLVEKLEHVGKDNGYEVWFQPVRCLATGQFCSMEALIRLREKDGSLIRPDEFIPIAEETGMIAPITWFVLEESCRLITAYPELATVNVSVNIPTEQLQDPGFLHRLDGIVDRYGIAHTRICLEQTERGMLGDVERLKKQMDKIAAAGYRFFLDDFGAGYSNFNCLLQLPIKNVKLDRSLTGEVTGASGGQDVVRMLTGAFRSLGVAVIAEGVETLQQVEILGEYGVDRIQGYYYAAPMPEGELISFYRENPLKEKG
ncbi:MAG: GGDEF domain-containing protein [Clostridia bacterium]|nr:GGDEF domain-containing protein [Clostridia bacterium]